MRVLVTGATGFIGSEIVSKLMTENFEIVGLSKNSGTKDARYKLLNADITVRQNILDVFENENFDAVIHCAGLAHQFGKIQREEFESVNVTGTKNITELAAKKNVKYFILLSSTAVYGLQDIPSDEEAVCHPETFYAESKLEAEKVCMEICERNDINLTIFRLSPVLGEKGIGNVPRLIEAIYKKRFVWVGNGENKKSLIFVGDIANACLRVLEEKRNSSEIYNLSAEPVKMRKLVSDISGRLGRTIPRFSIPAFLPNSVFGLNEKTFNLEFFKRISKTLEKWLSEDIYPADKFKRDYDFEARTSIEKAVERQCEWFLQNRMK